MTNKLEQVLIIDPPNELVFMGPFTSAVSSMMTLRNPTDRKICFKIKTTAPKRYCVKPNSGVIDPNEKVQVAVSLQPFEFDPNDKTRHKFMVQSMYAPDGEINQDQLWKDTNSNQLMDSKLRCVFMLPESGDSIVNNGETNDHGKFESIKASPQMASSGYDGSDSKLKKSFDEIKKLQEEISQLRQENIQLKEETLRQRRLAAAATSSGASHQSKSSSDSYSVTATSPDQSALSMTYIYMALVLLVLGIILGKWFI